MNMFCLQGKTAIVTGANTGLGQGICLALAEAGANIVGVARRSCTETKEAVEKKGGKIFRGFSRSFYSQGHRRNFQSSTSRVS